MSKVTQTSFRSLRLSREAGEVRSRVMPDVKRGNLGSATQEHVDAAATHLHTGSAKTYRPMAGWRYVSLRPATRATIFRAESIPIPERLQVFASSRRSSS